MMSLYYLRIEDFLEYSTLYVQENILSPTYPCFQGNITSTCTINLYIKLV